MIKYYSLHVQFELIEQPQEHRVDLIFLQLFALVNAGGLRGDKFNKDKAINRYEWLQLLVRIAIRA